MIAWLAEHLVPVHIAAGSLVFLTVPLGLLLPKGGRAHRMNGRLFFWAAFVLFVSDMIIGYNKNSALLLSGGLMTFYLALSGYRALWFKKLVERHEMWRRPGALDKGAAQFLLVCGVVIIIAVLTPGSDYPLPDFILTLGVAALALGVYDQRRFKQISTVHPDWLWQHMLRMSGAFLVALAGFAGFRLDFEPEVLRWLPILVAGFAAMALWASLINARLAKQSVSDLFPLQIALDKPDEEDRFPPLPPRPDLDGSKNGKDSDSANSMKD